MKLWTPALCLALLAAAPACANKATSAVPPAKGAPVLAVATLMEEVEKHKGVVRVEGVVAKVFPKQEMLALIDAEEFKRCGVVTCSSLLLPVRWKGAMPEVKSVVRVEGEIQQVGEKLELVARSLETAPK